MAKTYWWEEDQTTKTQAEQKPQDQEKKSYWWEFDSMSSTVGNDITNMVNDWANRHTGYLRTYQDRFSGRKGSYEDEYVGDAGNWLDTATVQRNSLDKDAQAILGYIDVYKEYLDPKWMKGVTEMLTSGRSQYDQVISVAKADADWWNRWASEDMLKEYGSAEEAYKAHQRYDGYSKVYTGKSTTELDDIIARTEDGEEKDWLTSYRGIVDLEEKGKFDLVAGQKEIDYLESVLRQAEEIDRQLVEINLNMDYHDPMRDDKRIKELTAQKNALFAEYGGFDAFKTMLAGKKQYLTLAGRVQEANTLSSVVNNNDFDANNDYISTEGKGFWDNLGSKFGMGYDDPTYEIVNRNNDAWSQVSVGQAFGKYSDKELSNLYSYKLMTEDEISIYNYHYAKEGREAAEKYLNSIQETLNYRAAEKMFSKMEDNALLELAFQVAVGFDQFNSGMEGLGNALFGNGEYVAPSATQIAGGMAREDLGDVDLKWYNFKEGNWNDAKIFGNSLGQVASDAISTTSNMLPSILTSAAVNLVAPGAGGVVGAALLGSSAGGNAYQEMINLGYDKSQARSYAALVGGSEAILQYALGGISSLSGGTNAGVFQSVAGKWLPHVDNAFARVAIKLGSNMLDEGLEEGLQEILNPWFKNLTLHTDESVNWSDVAYSSLLGALTAFFMEGRSTTAEDVKYYKTGKKLQAKDISAQRLAELGQTFAPETVAYQLAGKMNENTGAYTFGRLFNEVGATLTEQNISEITEALVEKGMSYESARKNAEALAYVVEGGQLSDGQIAMIEANDVLAEAARTTLIDANTTWNQRAKGYNEMLKALADDVASKKKSKAKQVQENAPTADTVDTQNESGTESHTESEEVDTSPAKVMSIADVGKKTIKLEDGSEVNVKDADLSPDDGVRIETIASIDGISTEDANFVLNILRSNTGASAQMDSLGAKEAYKYGFYGFSQEHIAKHGVFANSLTESQRQAIYNVGKKARQKQIENSSPKATTKATTKERGIYFDHGDGNVVAFKDADKSLLSEKKRAAGVQSAVILHKLGIGGDIYFFESYIKDGKRVYKDRNGIEKKAPNGWFSSGDGSIHIDLNAGVKGDGLVLFTLAHELTHFIEKWSPKKYKILADFLIENYEKGQSMDQRVLAKQADLKSKRGKEVSYDEAYSEVIADSMEAMLADGNVMEKIMELKAKDSDLVAKIKQFFDNLLAKIRNIYKNETPDSDEGKAVLEMTDSIERIQQLFAEALVEASDNFQTAEVQKNTTEDGGVAKMSVRDGFYSEVDSWDGKSDKTFVVGRTSDVLQSLGVKDSKVIWHSKKMARIMREHIGMTKDVIKQVPQILENPVVILASKQSDSRLVIFGTVTDANGMPVTAILELQPTNKGGKILDMNVIASAYGKDNTKNLVESSGLVYIDPDKKRTKSLMQGLGLRLPSDTTALGSMGKITYPDGKVKIESVPYGQYMQDIWNDAEVKKNSDRDSNGNQLTKEQQEYFKDSKVRDADGNLLVVYHGTRNANFTVFKRNVNFFTDSKEMADSYSPNGDMYEGYLNIKNPYEIDAAGEKWSRIPIDTETKNFLQEYGGSVFKESGKWRTTPADIASAVEEAVENGDMDYDGIIIRNIDDTGSYYKGKDSHVATDYISFTGNQFKKTDNKTPTSDPDMRYQDRAGESVSNRSLLANAFEGLAQNDIEKNKIQEYKGKIDLINAEERKLSELNAKIKELSFAKGPRDAKAIRGLQFEARQTANRINIYDKQLLRLEASKPLQDVLDREKKRAYQKAEQRGKEALDAYKEKAAETQRVLLEKWKESRKKGIEGRYKTAMRHKIKDVVNELNQYLLKGTKDRHVPESLQKAVAEALSAVNMDTVGAEERIAKLKAEMMKAKTPEQIQEISRKIDHISEMGDRMNGKLKRLKDAYEDLLKSPDENTRNAYDEVIHNKLDSVIDKIGNTPLRDMTLAQFEDVYDMYRMVLTAIRDVNKSFKDAKKQSISTRANAVMAQVEEVGGKHKLSAKILNGIKKFGWNNLKPVYAFEHIGSVTLTEAFNNVRAGEDVWAKDVVEAREFYLDKTKKYHYDSWDFQKEYKFLSTSEMEFSLTLEQILSLYAYSKRDQAADHLKYGGIVFDESTKIVKKVLGIPVEFNPTEATAYNISEETLADITSKLTDEQKDFADEMQNYLSTVMGAKGNEVSMAMYDIKLFKDKNYFPLKSAQQFMEKAREQQKGDVKIKNSGFSKETVPKAKNPIVLTPFMEVWSNHVNEMSMYHAFVLPLEDFYRIYNYKTPSKDETLATEGVNQYIQNAYGRAATAYIDQLLKDLNGGARTDSTTGFINKMIGLFKKGSVFASLSVVVQQPSAIARAVALVDTKYFIGPKVDHKRHKALWDEVKQYAPVAIIKEMGYFDTNMGKSTQDFILGKEYSGFKDKMKALVTDSNYRDEVLSKAPALADEIAWCSIWEAVKRETQAKNPGMDVKSDTFLKIAGERFTEVIVKTQVYDSVLARSGMMRSKDTGMKMATVFMAEPTTSINMIADALLQGKRGNRKYCRTTIGAVIASQILNSILVSFVYAGRDDDEDETYLEKYIGTLTGEVLDSLNPATYIPFIKDIVSIVQGYDVERSDMAVISDLWKAWENLSKDSVSPYQKVEGFVGSIAQIFGLPVKNIMRDARGIYQTIMSFVNGQQTTGAGIGYAVKSALPEWIGGGDVSNKQQLYEAYLGGDSEQIARVQSRFADQSAINTAMRSAIKDHFEAGDIDQDIAKQYLVEFGGMEEDKAYWRVEEWVYEMGSEEEFSQYNEFYEAVQTGKNLKAVIKKYTDHGVDAETLAGRITDYFKPLYKEMSNTERAGIKGYLLNAYVLLGYDRSKRSKDIDAWLKD